MSDSSISAACQSLCGSSSLHFSYENCCILAQHLFLTPVLYYWNSCDSRGDQLHLCSFAHDTSLFNRLQVTDLYSTGYNLECEVSHLTGEATNSQFISCCSLYIILAKKNQATGMQAIIIRCLSQARKIGRVAAERAFGVKMGGLWRY